MLFLIFLIQAAFGNIIGEPSCICCSIKIRTRSIRDIVIYGCVSEWSHRSITYKLCYYSQSVNFCKCIHNQCKHLRKIYYELPENLYLMYYRIFVLTVGNATSSVYINYIYYAYSTRVSKPNALSQSKC